ARAMMIDGHIPTSMWAKAVYAANYLHARSPTAANKGMTPNEKLHGTEPAVAHLRSFGCRTYRAVPASQRTKFGSRAEMHYLVGYVHVSTTILRLWDPASRQAVQASNVTCDESG
ncbi:hypothetical protein BZA05DRAFT_318257, partial [Tricharina praecox]|uniref:uncharacterized protein n=1 Tax=Tricharina praecox TaxID=43433 RepID=UPI00221F5606